MDSSQAPGKPRTDKETETEANTTQKALVQRAGAWGAPFKASATGLGILEALMGKYQEEESGKRLATDTWKGK